MADLPSVVEAINDLITRIERLQNSENGCEIGSIVLRLDYTRQHPLREMLRLILQENSFQFNGKDFLQTHGTATETKTAVSFANIFMAKIETAIIDQHSTKPLL